MDELRNRLKRRYGGWRRIHAELCPREPFNSFTDSFDASYRTYRPFATLAIACKKAGLPQSQLEKSILSYRTTRGRAVVEEAKLPVVVSPVFDMLIAHIFGDGCCRKTEGREITMNYRQYDETLLSNFIKKTETVFGRLKYRHEYFYTAKRFHLPSVCSAVLAGYYALGARDFLSHKARIPSAIYSKPRAHLVAFLTAFIIDEATVDSSLIAITLCNKGLVDDLGKLCSLLGYKHTVRYKTLYILADGVRSFWRDYLRLKNHYPEVNMGYREDAILNFILRGRKHLRTRGKGKCLNEMAGLLSEKQRTIGELSKILLISRQGVRFHMQRLQLEGVVKMVGEGRAGGFIYQLKRRKHYAVSQMGESHSFGTTKKKILAFLNQNPRTSLELSNKLKIGASAVRMALGGLKAQGRIKICKKVVLKTRPAYVWCVR